MTYTWNLPWLYFPLSFSRVSPIYIAAVQKEISDSIAGKETDVQWLFKNNIDIRSFFLK